MLHIPYFQCFIIFGIYANISIYSKDNKTLKIRNPEIITHLCITNMSSGSSIFPLIGKLVSIRLLHLSHDNIYRISEYSFAGLIELEMLDLSHNSIIYIPTSFWCSREKLRYLYLNNNNLTKLEFHLLFCIKELRVVTLQANRLLSIQVQSFGKTTSLLFVTSDIAKLCCMVSVKIRCSPEFSMNVSCTSLMTNKLQVYTVWLIGSTTTICNSITLVLVIACLIKLGAAESTLVMSFACNLSIADTLTSVCLFMIPIVNWYYEGKFGMYADIWTKSLSCHALEVIVFLSVETSLIFTSMIAKFVAIVIPSMTEAKSYSTAKRLAIGLCWCIIATIGLGRQTAVHFQEFHNDNYFCLPFFNNSTGYVSKIFNFIITLCNLLLVVIVIVSYSYFLQYLFLNHEKSSKYHSKKRRPR